MRSAIYTYISIQTVLISRFRLSNYGHPSAARVDAVKTGGRS